MARFVVQVDTATNDVVSLSRHGNNIPVSTAEREIIEVAEVLWNQIRNTPRDGRAGNLWFKDPGDGQLKERPDNRRTVRAVSGGSDTTTGPLNIDLDVGDIETTLTLQVLTQDLTGVDTNINVTRFLSLEGLRRVKLTIVNGEVTLPVRTGRSYAVRLESNPDFKMENTVTVEVFSTAFD